MHRLSAVFMALMLALVVPAPTAPAQDADQAASVGVQVSRSGAYPWHVEIEPGTTVVWTLQENWPVDIRGRDGTLWCHMNILNSTCSKTFAGLGHHGYIVEVLYPNLGTSVTTDPDNAVGAATTVRDEAAVNVLADLGAVEILDFWVSFRGNAVSFPSPATIVFVFDGWRGEGAVTGPDGFLCNFSFTGEFCSLTLSDLGKYRFKIYDTQNPGPGAWDRGSVTIQIQGDPPTLSIATPVEGATVSGAFTVTGTASAEAGVDRIRVLIPGRSWETATGTTNWTFAVGGEILPPGPVTFTVRVSALDGQVVEQTRTVHQAVPGPVDLKVTKFYAAKWNAPGEDLGCSHFTCVADPVLFQYPYLIVEAYNGGEYAVTSVLRIEYLERGEWRLLYEENMTIGAGQKERTSTYWLDPLRFGSWPARATIDADDVFPELDELDNQFRRRVDFPTSFGSQISRYNAADLLPDA